MADYKAIGNFPLSELLGKEGAEKVLKGLNFCKEIATQLGAEHNPPYVWNENIPMEWVKTISLAIIDKLEKDINWKPSPLFIASLRKELNKEE